MGGPWNITPWKKTIKSRGVRPSRGRAPGREATLMPVGMEGIKATAEGMYGCWTKNRGFPPKWMVKIVENPMNKWMIWGENPLFLETSVYQVTKTTKDLTGSKNSPKHFQVPKMEVLKCLRAILGGWAFPLHAWWTMLHFEAGFAKLGQSLVVSYFLNICPEVEAFCQSRQSFLVDVPNPDEI